MRELVVLDAGLLSTVQDLGRPGFAHLGVPRSGAVDEPALRLANRLVGNPESAAGLETTLTGLRLRCQAAMTVAVCGAPGEVRVAGRAVEFGAAISANAGDEVWIGTARHGLRSYLAVAGGIDVEPVLGSRSTDLLSGLGPPVLSAGQRLPVADPQGSPEGAQGLGARPGQTIRVQLGPREDLLTAAAIDRLDAASYTVGAASNRIGLRLEGRALTRVGGEELPSEGIVLGAVQVPSGGQPLVFLNDHPVTGGYPVIGVVLTEDLPVCAQARPGDRLTLRVVR